MARAKGAVESTGKNKAAWVHKEKWAARGYRSLWWVYGFTVATIVTYVAITIAAAAAGG